MDKLWTKSWVIIWALVFTLILNACGGGTNGPEKCYSPTPAVCAALGVERSFPTTTTSAVGLYKGLTNNGRTVAGLSFSDNSFYAIYSGVNNPLIAGGVIQGTLRADAGKFTVTDALDVNLEGLGIQVVSITGAYGDKQFLNGSVDYPAIKQTVSFLSNYSSDFESTPSIATVVGTYVGTSKNSTGSETITINVNETGIITGKSGTGCAFSGTIQPRTSGNAYVVSITFGASPCRLAGNTLNGVSYFDPASNLAYTAASVPGKNDSFVIISTKQ